MTTAAAEVTVNGFRSVMAGFPTGVAVVATVDPAGQPRGMTCSSVCSVTLTPPTLLVCLHSASATLAAITGSGTFAVNLLCEQAKRTAELFASGAPDRFDRVRWERQPDWGGPHLVDDAHAVAHCRLTRTLNIGDHVVAFGEVFRLWQRAGQNPLLYGQRRYSAWR